MRFNCLGCGYLIYLGYDYDNYKGRVRCSVCGTISSIETQDGEIRGVEPEGLQENRVSGGKGKDSAKRQPQESSAPSTEDE